MHATAHTAIINIVSTYLLYLSTVKDNRHEKEERTLNVHRSTTINRCVVKTSNAQEGGMKNRAIGEYRS